MNSSTSMDQLRFLYDNAVDGTVSEFKPIADSHL
jgi:hypothetical protein